ncbi:MAG: hypothetical protein WDM89_07100 [Rhizomicrobium sp.]
MKLIQCGVANSAGTIKIAFVLPIGSVYQDEGLAATGRRNDLVYRNDTALSSARAPEIVEARGIPSKYPCDTIAFI